MNTALAIIEQARAGGFISVSDLEQSVLERMEDLYHQVYSSVGLDKPLDPAASLVCFVSGHGPSSSSTSKEAPYAGWLAKPTDRNIKLWALFYGDDAGKAAVLEQAAAWLSPGEVLQLRDYLGIKPMAGIDYSGTQPVIVEAMGSVRHILASTPQVKNGNLRYGLRPVSWQAVSMLLPGHQTWYVCESSTGVETAFVGKEYLRAKSLDSQWQLANPVKETMFASDAALRLASKIETLQISSLQPSLVALGIV
jgi:hypothetical protein